AVRTRSSDRRTEHTAPPPRQFPELFSGRRVVLAPGERGNRRGRHRPRRGDVGGEGAAVALMPAARHDSIFATVNTCRIRSLLRWSKAGAASRSRIPSTAAGGFWDSTRIASSSPRGARYRDRANRDALLAELRVYRNQLERMERMLAASDAEGLGTLFATAREARNEWLAGQR
ncbi:MAG: prephenate dehydrogenase/arogenate dehydrogenase family protein, partial [Betaproteobacteria bacterium]|nr:prephenate dehydrogenase/arogenate dehydrogenase family protein [Betaproteobacteria bacterium]